MDKTLINGIKAAKVHINVGKYIRENIKCGLSLKDIAIIIENKIKDEIDFDINNPLDRGIAFPVGLSLNNCAAHYTPNYNETEIILKEDDIIKIDYGVHIGGTIIDSAFTLHFNEKYNEFINISKKITNYAVSLCNPGKILGEIGAEIEEYIQSKEIIINGITYPIKIMRDLSGHMIRKYEIHAGIAVPNIAIDYDKRIKEFEYYAIEPFITTGNGISILKEPISHYMINKNYNNLNNNLNKTEKKVYKIIKDNYHTLPFCQRWLYELNSIYNYDNVLNSFKKKNIIDTFPPIYDIDNSIISQFEHTIFIKENGIINLTKNDFY